MEAHQRHLRKGRFSHQGYWYFITTSTKNRLPVFSDPAAAKVVMGSLNQYYDHAIRTEDELKECLDYCLRNPVRKGLVDNFKNYPHWYCAYEV